MARMTEQDETILSAMIEQHDPRTAERVLELMDGEIQVLSEEKQGSTFIVTLPMAGKEFGQL